MRRFILTLALCIPIAAAEADRSAYAEATRETVGEARRGGPAQAQDNKGNCMTPTGITLRIPGPWPDLAALTEAIRTRSDGSVIMAGGTIQSPGTTAQISISLETHDSDLSRAMFIGSGRSFDKNAMEAIDAHKSIACVSVLATPSGVETDIARAAGALRDAGGLAVNVPKSGLSHGWERWQTLMGTPSPTRLLQALVLQVPDRDKDQLCSFGMKQFGAADACVLGDATSDAAAWVVFEFNLYAWVESPRFKDGQTFSRNLPDATRYKLKLVRDARYAPDHDFFNSFGVWQMSPVKAGR